jgi:hypothetical protein
MPESLKILDTLLLRIPIRFKVYWNVINSIHRTQKQVQAWALTIDNSLCWGFFDGAYQGMTCLYGAGFILYFLDKYMIKVQANLGLRTNNLGYFKALYMLLKVDLDRDVLHVQNYGNLSLVIK